MVTKKRFISVLMLAFAGLSCPIVGAGDFYREAMIMGGYSERDIWVGRKDKGIKNSLGFEYYRKFSNDYGDFLTLDVQVRAGYDSKEDSQDAFGIEIHNAWAEYNLGLGKAIRLGHFDPAFGLEPVLDTHGTLLQTLASKNIGFKKDWGIAYKGMLGDYDYEVAAQIGSGMGIRRKDGSYLMTGRIGTPQTREFRYGLSFLYGRTLRPGESWTIPASELLSNRSVRKKRIGVDLQFPLGPVEFKGEVAAGDNDGTTAGGALAEFAYTVPGLERLELKLQGTYWSNDWDKKNTRDSTIAPVIEYEVTPSLSARLGYFHDIDSPGSSKDRLVLLQLYYYGK